MNIIIEKTTIGHSYTMFDCDGVMVNKRDLFTEDTLSNIKFHKIHIRRVDYDFFDKFIRGTKCKILRIDYGKTNLDRVKVKKYQNLVSEALKDSKAKVVEFTSIDHKGPYEYTNKKIILNDTSLIKHRAITTLAELKNTDNVVGVSIHNINPDDYKHVSIAKKCKYLKIGDDYLDSNASNLLAHLAQSNNLKHLTIKSYDLTPIIAVLKNLLANCRLDTLKLIISDNSLAELLCDTKLEVRRLVIPVYRNMMKYLAIIGNYNVRVDDHFTLMSCQNGILIFVKGGINKPDMDSDEEISVIG